MTDSSLDNKPAAPTVGIKKHLPNALVILRLAIAALVFAILTVADATWLGWAAALFVIAAITDALDGFLARRWNAISLFGRVMDPFADKVLVLGSIILLTPYPGFTPLMAAIIVIRELLVTSLRAVAEAQGQDFSASAAGKAKMIIQSGCVPAIMFLIPLGATPESGPFPGFLIDLLAWTTTIVTLWSAFPYLFNAWDAFSGGRYQPNPRTPLQREQHSAARALTVHGFGLLRPFPGTWGSLPPVFLAALMIAGGVTPSALPTDAGPASGSLAPHWPLVPFYLVLAGVFLWACWACITKGHLGEAVFNKKDPGAVVADEVAGMCIPLIALPITAQTPWLESSAWLIGAFLAFRFFDIIKPSPARDLQHVRGGWGILLDDLVAGFYALLTIQIIAAGLSLA